MVHFKRSKSLLNLLKRKKIFRFVLILLANYQRKSESPNLEEMRTQLFQRLRKYFFQTLESTDEILNMLLVKNLWRIHAPLNITKKIEFSFPLNQIKLIFKP